MVAPAATRRQVLRREKYYITNGSAIVFEITCPLISQLKYRVYISADTGIID